MPLNKLTADSRIHHHHHLNHQALEQASDDDYSAVKEPYVDLRQMYAFSKANGSGSSRSLSSRTTSLSVSTCHASNTTRAKQEKKKQKRKFRKFTKWLMRFLEKKDPRVFGKAQAVIRDCEERKERGEEGYESVTDSLKEPLREAVGNTYWREARYHLDSFLLNSSQSLSSLSSSSSSESSSDHENVNVPPARARSASSSSDPLMGQPIQTPIQQHRRAHSSSMRIEASPLSTQSVWNLGEENKIRRERFYMILRVLMKYLETKNYDLYSKTKEVIHDCCARNDNSREDYGALLESIKRQVKQVVGDSYWRRAESYLSKAILRQARADAIGEARSSHQRPRQELSPVISPRVAIHSPRPTSEVYESNNMIASHGIGPAEEEPQGKIEEFFVNACHTFTTSAKRTMEEHATTITTAASHFCFRGTTQAEPGPMCFDYKRRRLHASSQNMEGRPRI